MSSQYLFAVTHEGEFYKRGPPQNASDCWMASISKIGSGGWNDFHHLFFHPDGILYGVVNDKFYRGPPPRGCSSEEWVEQATLIGKGGWNSFKFLFFDPDGVLYGVKDESFYERAPPSDDEDRWLGSATLIGATGWSDFKFLFFDPKGILHGVKNGKLFKRKPPVDRDDAWFGSSKLVDWNDHGYKHLLFMASGELYGCHSSLFKGSPPTGGNNRWSVPWTLIGNDGWHQFKFLISPLGK